MKKDLNYIAKLEQAIAKKYGDEAIRNFRSDWDDKKEKEYLEQLEKSDMETNFIYRNGFWAPGVPKDRARIGSNDPNAAAKERHSIQKVRCFTNGLLFPSLAPITITRPEKPAKTIANSEILAVEEASISNSQLAAT
jgi:hypothetical protein